MEEHPAQRQPEVTLQVEPTTSFSVPPGASITISAVVHNQGGADEVFELAVQGLPTPWLSVPSPVIRLVAG